MKILRKKKKTVEMEIDRLYREHNFGLLEKEIGISFRDRSLLINAFVHRSFLNENHDLDLNNNERLEFLGDAVLSFLVAEKLYKTYPNSEGELTRWRSALVNTKILADLARRLKFQDYLFLSRGEKENLASDSVLADAFEAFVGAVCHDQGFEAAKKIIEDRLITLLPEIINSSSYIDPKSRLQEIVQSNKKITPNYQVISETGPDHNKHFKVVVSVNNQKLGQGTGRSKQAAEQAAAERALNLLEKDR